MEAFWRNDYNRIYRENEKGMVKISDDNCRSIIRICQYISAFPVSMFQLEVIRKDLIGLAMEADMDNISLEEKLGVSEEEFSKELIKEAERPDCWEKVLYRIRNFILGLTILYTLSFAFARFNNSHGLPVSSIITAFIIVIAIEIARDLILRKGGYYSSVKKTVITRVLYGILAISLFVGRAIAENMTLFSGHGWMIFVLLMTASAVFCVVDHRYWNRCSTRYDWK